LVGLTPEGAAIAEPAGIGRTTEALQAAVYSRLDARLADIVRVLVAAYPQPLSRADVAGAIGMQAGGGGFANYLGKLRGLGLIDYPASGLVKAEGVLFL